MLTLSDAEIDAASGRVPPGLEKHRWIQDRAPSCDVTSDVGFQRRFEDLYRIRREPTCCRPYFRLLEDAKAEPISFSDALGVLRERFDRAFPDSGVSDLKKIDLVLRQHRSPP